MLFHAVPLVLLHGWGVQRSLQFNLRPNLRVLPEHLVGFSCETRVVYISVAGSNCISQPEVEPRIDPYHAGAKIELSSWLLRHFLLNDPCPPIFPELTCTQGIEITRFESHGMQCQTHVVLEMQFVSNLDTGFEATAVSCLESQNLRVCN